jgi:HEAT repeat protein
MAWWKSDQKKKNNRETQTSEDDSVSRDDDKASKTFVQKSDNAVFPVKPHKNDNARKNDKTAQLKTLVAALKDKNGSVRSHAAWALGQLGDAKAIESLVPLLTDKDTDVRRDVSDALKRLGFKPKR